MIAIFVAIYQFSSTFEAIVAESATTGKASYIKFYHLSLIKNMKKDIHLSK
jgi:hypothetical protein